MWHLLVALAHPPASLHLAAAAGPLTRAVRRAAAAAQRDPRALTELARALCDWHACLALLRPALAKGDRRRLRRETRRQCRLLPKSVWREVWLRPCGDGWCAANGRGRPSRPLAGKAARDLRRMLRRQVRLLAALADAPPDETRVRAGLARLHRRARRASAAAGGRRRATILTAAVELVCRGRGLTPQSRLDASALAVPTERFLAVVEWDRFTAAAAYVVGGCDRGGRG